MYCIKDKWELNAPAADNIPIAEEIPENADGGEPQKTDPVKPNAGKVAHPKRRYAPRIKGIVRRHYVLGQSKMREKLTDAKTNASRIATARQMTSRNHMIRATERAAKTMAAVGDGTVCPECHKVFS